jgi:biopolymer transport protein ExbD/biopolymer transport protein TolR
MSVDTGGSESRKGVQPEINVTPLVDVVLVLLIIFMVITPLLTKNFWVHTPKQEKEEVEQERADEPDAPLVLRVLADREISVNGSRVELAELPERLRRMFAARDDHVLFFDAHDDVEYGFAVQVMDGAREGGAVTIATLTAALEGSASDPTAGAAASGTAAPALPVAPPDRHGRSSRTSSPPSAGT